MATIIVDIIQRKFKQIFFVIILPLSVLCEFYSAEYIIDSPTAYLPWTSFSIASNVSFTSAEDPYPVNYSGYFASLFLMGKIKLGISLFKEAGPSFDAKVNILSETKNRPTISFGCWYITPHKYISPVGIGDSVGWPDDQSYGEKRNTEQFSWLIVLTKDLGTYGMYNLGIGRGAFVGYGPRSRLFNTDLISGGHNNNAIGIIWGAQFYLFANISAGIEFDGRDFNIGLKYSKEYLQIGVSASKLEHRLKGSPFLYPRISFGASINSYLVRRWLGFPAGELVVIVRVGGTGEGKRAIITFPGTSIPAIETNSSTGECSMKLSPGVYWVRASIPGYWFAEKEVFVSPGTVTYCELTIYPMR